MGIIAICVRGLSYKPETLPKTEKELLPCCTSHSVSQCRCTHLWCLCAVSTYSQPGSSFLWKGCPQQSSFRDWRVPWGQWSRCLSLPCTFQSSRDGDWGPNPQMFRTLSSKGKKEIATSPSGWRDSMHGTQTGGNSATSQFINVPKPSSLFRYPAQTCRERTQGNNSIHDHNKSKPNQTNKPHLE